ncbi:MAG: RNase III inhibitor [Sphaerospermopsis sp. SIO1G2]|nr:RNase III inhibitor [Sphaerospermopsis sp. SIO1G1]NET73607.1 RNase III inhibitor [Sphaerospermopsis sp. SIO1G2]
MNYQANIKIVQGDIINQQVEAIVNATNKLLSGKGGVASAIRKAAGKELEKHCLKLIPLNVGEAKITPGYNLSVPWIIHTHGPLWIDGISGIKEEQLLRQCYHKSLTLMPEYHIKSIAFPGIATGVHGFPKDKAAAIAVNAAMDFLSQDNEHRTVIFVCWTDFEYSCYENVLQKIQK